MTDWTPDLITQLRDLAAQKMSAAQICRAIDRGFTRSAILGAARRNKIPLLCPNSGPLPRKERVRKVLSLFGNAVRFASEVAQGDARQATIVPLNISFADLQFGKCKYATTDAPPHLFCGHPALEENPYCFEHNAICHAPRMTRGELVVLKQKYRSRKQTLEAAE